MAQSGNISIRADGEPGRRPLRFGVIVDAAAPLLAWQADCLQQLCGSNDARPVLVVHAQTPRPSSFAYRRAPGVYRLLKNRLCRPPAARAAEMPGAMLGALQVRCSLQPRPAGRATFRADDLERVRQADLDFILHLGRDELRGRILGAARLGVWAFHHGDAERSCTSSEGFLATANGDRVVVASLRRLVSPRGQFRRLKYGCFAVARHSWAATRQNLLAEGARWPLQVCADVGNGVAAYLEGGPIEHARKPRREPTHADAIRFTVNVIRGWTRRWFDHMFVQMTWGIGLTRHPLSSPIVSQLPDVQFADAPASGYRYLADPFCVTGKPGSEMTLLCEHYDLWKTNRGVICEVALQGSRAECTPATGIHADVHASYPFVFQNGEEQFCVPEVGASRKVELYRRAGNTGDAWVRCGALVTDFAVLDPTVFRHDGRWWLAATSLDHGEYHNLFLWHADSLDGPWTDHAQFPAKSDVRSARPAGTPFIHEGRLYRPAQDCSEGYGRRISINLIEKLTPTEFSERAVAVIGPDRKSPFPHGIHTINFVQGHVLVDGRRDFFDPLKQLKKRLLAPISRRLFRALATS